MTTRPWWATALQWGSGPRDGRRHGVAGTRSHPTLRYSHSAKWFRLDLADGWVVRISAMLQGLPEFAAAVLAQVPPAAIDGDTRTVLEATARGELPRVWS